MLRITQVETESEPRLLLEGRITKETAVNIAELCEVSFTRSPSLALDMGGVSFVDLPSVPILNRLRALGVTFERCSSFVVELLGEPASKPASEGGDDPLIAALRRGDEEAF